MLRTLEKLKNFEIEAIDGEIGKVGDFYFDDERWAARYMVVDTGGWLTGRQVLISPLSITKIDWFANRIGLRLTKKQIEESPGIEADMPVSRQREAEYFKHFDYPYYWTGPYVWGPAPLPGRVAIPRPAEVDRANSTTEKQNDADVHLRSVREVTGYYIAATDGDIGHVEEFVFDDESWIIRYLIVDTRNWLPGKKVLVSPEWVSSVSWSDRKVSVDLTRDSIKSCPEYDPYQPIDRDYEECLYKHYGHKRYWVP